MANRPITERDVSRSLSKYGHNVRFLPLNRQSTLDKDCLKINGRRVARLGQCSRRQGCRQSGPMLEFTSSDASLILTSSRDMVTLSMVVGER